MNFLALALVAVVPDPSVHAVTANGDVTVRVSLDKKPALDIKGGATVRVEGDTVIVDAPARADGEKPVCTVVLDTRALSLTATGNALIVLAPASLASLDVRASGTSHVDADAATAGTVDATLGDASRAEVHIADKGALTVALKRAARLSVKGHPGAVKKTVEGVAKLVTDG